MATKKIAARKKTTRKKINGSTTRRKWSKKVTEHSNALDLEKNVFKKKDPKKIASSLKSSAEHSGRKKAGSYQSAMSMLNFYINRAGKGLTKKGKATIGKSKRRVEEIISQG